MTPPYGMNWLATETEPQNSHKTLVIIKESQQPFPPAARLTLLEWVSPEFDKTCGLCHHPDSSPRPSHAKLSRFSAASRFFTSCPASLFCTTTRRGPRQLATSARCCTRRLLPTRRVIWSRPRTRLPAIARRLSFSTQRILLHRTARPAPLLSRNHSPESLTKFAPIAL